MSGLLIFLLLLNAYILLVYLLHRFGKLGGDFELAGVFLMWRTQLGKKTIDRVARAKGFWKVYGDIGIWVTWTAGILLFAALIWQLFIFATNTEQVAQATPGPQYLIGLPGVNPIIPIGYGLFALIVALIIHEGAHGVLARVGNMGVKSLGLLLFIVPIGAFVEPDERDLEKSSTRARNRVYAAGPMANIVLATVAILLFSGVVMSSTVPAQNVEGVWIAGVVPDTPASAAGLMEGDMIATMDGRQVTNLSAFQDILGDKRPGDVLSFTYYREGERYVPDEPVILANASAFNAGASGAFLGVQPMNPAELKAVRGVLANPFTGGLATFGFFIAYPFYVLFRGVDVMNAPFSTYLNVEGPLSVMPEWGFFLIANTLYWLFWINFMLGTFNALPAGPLDGGQMLRATLRERLMKRFNVTKDDLVFEPAEGGRPGYDVRGADDATQDKLDRIQVTIKRTTMTVGFTILGLILVPILGPTLIRLLG